MAMSAAAVSVESVLAPAADLATVHIIAHSHEDPGWLLTSDECESLHVDHPSIPPLHCIRFLHSSQRDASDNHPSSTD
jgi:hypothetical protein